LNYRPEGGRVLYGEDVYVGYRYFDKISLPPLFPFGYGLSYTSFTFSDLSIQIPSASTISATISVKITNTGSCAGGEVAQLYIAPVQPRINRPPKELKGFKKVFLEKGEAKVVEIEMDIVRSTSFWDEYAGKWCSENGVYKVLVGNTSCSDATFLEGEVVVEKATLWLGL
jgi:beta-glucosidase